MVVWTASSSASAAAAASVKLPTLRVTAVLRKRRFLLEPAFFYGAPGMARSALTGAVPVQVVLTG